MRSGSLGNFFFALQPHSFWVAPVAIVLLFRMACQFPLLVFSTKMSGIVPPSLWVSEMMHLGNEICKDSDPLVWGPALIHLEFCTS